MRSRKIVIILAALAGLSAYFFVGNEAKFPIPPNIESGDVIFRKENSFWGDVSSAAARVDGKYSHSGIAYVDKGKVYVIHAYADTNEHIAKVSRQSLEEFLNNATTAGFYRLNFTPEIRAEVAKKANEYYEKKTPFDDQFSLTDDSAVYCTELVWRAAKLGSGYDIAPNKSLLMNRQFIGNDDLFLGGFMNELKQ